jgi:hypothetical protein
MHGRPREQERTADGRHLQGEDHRVSRSGPRSWLDGTLIGKGHAFDPDEALSQAQELVDPEDIDDLEIDYRGCSVDWP